MGGGKELDYLGRVDMGERPSGNEEFLLKVLAFFFDNGIVFRLFTKIANRIDLIYFCVFLVRCDASSSSFRHSEGYCI